MGRPRPARDGRARSAPAALRPGAARWQRARSRTPARLLRRRQRLPRRDRVEAPHRPRHRVGARPEVGLVELAVVAHDEAHHPGLAVARRPGDEREARGHPALDHVAVRTARCARALRGQRAEAVAVVGVAGPLAGEQRAQRAVRLAGERRPVQAVAPARRADDPPRVLEHAVAVAVTRRVLLLRVEVRGEACIAASSLRADATGPDLLRAARAGSKRQPALRTIGIGSVPAVRPTARCARSGASLTTRVDRAAAARNA